jgi:hypothetical protein
MGDALQSVTATSIRMPSLLSFEIWRKPDTWALMPPVPYLLMALSTAALRSFRKADECLDTTWPSVVVNSTRQEAPLLDR